ncbi:hypothetical protein DB30_01865 [Enhygromyxa salina]|uniref:Uncharacterized protein n=2 Tax=Enhygromyxa salina TaxID=215803 RepID=A0A0C2CWF5_9BACT|nr:hypothetical protein DB30_01865 [Enhygromyxa salina]
MLFALTLTALACAEPELEPAEDCSTEPPTDTSMLAQRSVRIGHLDGATFVPWVDGQEVQSIIGFQGSSMITPYIDLPTEAGDVDGACWWVEIEYLSPIDNLPGGQTGLVFSQEGESMRAGPLFEQPDTSYYGKPVTVRVTVASRDFVAVDEVEIVIRS